MVEPHNTVAERIHEEEEDGIHEEEHRHQVEAADSNHEEAEEPVDNHMVGHNLRKNKD